jgi:hypothetical protein
MQNQISSILEPQCEPVRDLDLSAVEMQESTVEESTVEESTVEESTVEESTVEESTVKESTVEEPTVEESTVEESTVEEQEPLESIQESLKVTQESNISIDLLFGANQPLSGPLPFSFIETLENLSRRVAANMPLPRSPTL